MQELAQKLKERRTQHYHEMLQVQKEQERMQQEEEAHNRMILEKKEKQLRDEMQKAIDVTNANQNEAALEILNAN